MILEASPGENHPIWTLERIAGRLLAPLTPMFVAMSARWTAQIGPATVLMALLLMIFFGMSAGGICQEATTNAAFRRFLNLESRRNIDVLDLAAAIERLLRNENARQFVRDVLAGARGAGLLGTDASSFDSALADAWISEPPPPAPLA